MLEDHLRARLRERDILLMTHIVLGYPSFDDSRRIGRKMGDLGGDLDFSAVEVGGLGDGFVYLCFFDFLR